MKMTVRSLEVSCNKHVRKCYASAWLIGLSVLKESTINYPILSYPYCLRGLADDDIVYTCNICHNRGFCYNCFCKLADENCVVCVPEWMEDALGNVYLAITIYILCIPEIGQVHEFTIYNPYE